MKKSQGTFKVHCKLVGLHAHVYGNFAENVKDGEMNFNRKHMTKCNEDIYL